MSNKPIIVVFIAYYLPGYKFGGPIRTVANLIEQLGDEFDFRIITRDRDEGDCVAYHNVQVNHWQKQGNAWVYYSSPKHCTLKNILKTLHTVPYDVIYLNSFFDPTFTVKILFAKFFKQLTKKPILLAPKGELADAALALKRWKKWCYIAVIKLSRLRKNIYWHASTDQEASDIKKQLLIRSQHIYTALDVTRYDMYASSQENYDWMNHASIKMLFLSRIHPVKNLYFALEILQLVTCRVTFNIYGLINDTAYWKKCQNLFAKLPQNVHINYCGYVEHDHVLSIFSQHDIFFLPTLSENYGHVVAESLMVGTPVLVSDQTPWRNLSKHELGWDLPLSDKKNFANAIEQCAMMSVDARQKWRQLIKNKARQKLMSSESVISNRTLFSKLITCC